MFVDTCQIFQCTCQGVSNNYGISDDQINNRSAPKWIKDWWTRNNCKTKPGMCLRDVIQYFLSLCTHLKEFNILKTEDNQRCLDDPDWTVGMSTSLENRYKNMNDCKLVA